MKARDAWTPTKVTRHVRTPAGAREFDLPIGAPIVPHPDVDAARGAGPIGVADVDQYKLYRALLTVDEKYLTLHRGKTHELSKRLAANFHSLRAIGNTLEQAEKDGLVTCNRHKWTLAYHLVDLMGGGSGAKVPSPPKVPKARTPKVPDVEALRPPPADANPPLHWMREGGNVVRNLSSTWTLRDAERLQEHALPAVLSHETSARVAQRILADPGMNRGGSAFASYRSARRDWADAMKEHYATIGEPLPADVAAEIERVDAGLSTDDVRRDLVTYANAARQLALENRWLRQADRRRIPPAPITEADLPEAAKPSILGLTGSALFGPDSKDWLESLPETLRREMPGAADVLEGKAPMPGKPKPSPAAVNLMRRRVEALYTLRHGPLTPPYHGPRETFDLNDKKHVRALKAALSARDYTKSTLGRENDRKVAASKYMDDPARRFDLPADEGERERLLYSLYFPPLDMAAEFRKARALDATLREHLAVRAEAIAARYPIAAATLKKIQVTRLKPGTYADYSNWSAQIRWSTDYSSYTSAAAHVQNDVRSGWHPPGTDTPDSILVHEFGHHLQYALTPDQRVELWTLIDAAMRKEHGTMGELLPSERSPWSIDGNVHKRWRGKWTRAVSRYAERNDHELFAEAFAEYHFNPHPRTIARIIGEYTDRVFGVTTKRIAA